MSYPPQYPPGDPYGNNPASGPQYTPQPNPYHYPPPNYGPAPKPPSSGGNTVAVVVISVVAAGILLLIGIVGFVLFMSPSGDDTSGDRPDTTGAGPDFNVDGEWEGTLTQYDYAGDVHGYFDVSITIEGNEVVHAEETSEEFDFDLCEWDVYGVTWNGNTLNFDYEVVPEHQHQSCVNVGDAEVTFHDYGAADISSNEVAEGVLYPVD